MASEVSCNSVIGKASGVGAIVRFVCPLCSRQMHASHVITQLERQGNVLYVKQPVSGRGRGVGAIGFPETLIDLAAAAALLRDRQAFGGNHDELLMASAIADDLEAVKRAVIRLAMTWRQAGIIEKSDIGDVRKEQAGAAFLEAAATTVAAMTHRTVAKASDDPAILLRPKLRLGGEDNWAAEVRLGGKNPKLGESEGEL